MGIHWKTKGGDEPRGSFDGLGGLDGFGGFSGFGGFGGFGGFPTILLDRSYSKRTRSQGGYI